MLGLEPALGNLQGAGFAGEAGCYACVRGFYRVRKEGGNQKVTGKEFIHTRGKEQGNERKGKKGKDRQEQSIA
jgi:hypothetical protein